MPKKPPRSSLHSPGGPLASRDLLRLDELLAARPLGVNGVEHLDGLLTAAIAGPDLVMPSEIMPLILGDPNDPAQPEFDTAAEIEELIGLIMRHWNSIAAGLFDGDYQPVLLTFGDREFGTDWALGFATGMSLRTSRWRPLINNPKQFAAIQPILILATENDPDPNLRTGPIKPGRRKILLDQLGPAAVGVRHFFMASGPVAPSSPGRRPPPGTSPPPPAKPHWEAGWIPIPGSIAAEPDTRLVAALITTDLYYVLRLTPEAAPPSDPAALAKRLVREVEAAVAEHGPPPEVWVLDQASATALRRSAAMRHVVIEIADGLPAFERVRADFAAEFAGSAGRGNVASAQTWTGWGLAEPLVAGLFQAAAGLFRSAPWRLYTDGQPLLVSWPSGLEWMVVVMGAAGIERGIACLADPADFFDDPDVVLDPSQVRGLMVSVTYSPQDDLPPPMRKEIMGHGWEVAAVDAFPMAMVLNSPTAGLAPEVAEQLIEVMGAVARYGATKTARRGRQWADKATGIVVMRV